MQRCYRDNAIYINLPPDHIIGNGLFNMINNCPQGGAAGGGLLRASANKTRSFMQTNDFLQLLKQKNRNNELAKMVFSNWRIDFHRYFESPFTQHTNFSIKNGKVFLNQPFGAIFVAKPNENFLTTLQVVEADCGNGTSMKTCFLRAAAFGTTMPHTGIKS